MVWSKNWTPCLTGNSTLSTRPPPPMSSESRQGRIILTAVEFRKITDGPLLLGSYDRSVPRSCCWQAREIIDCQQPHTVFASVEKSADFETERQGDFQKSLCQWAANMSRNVLRIDCCPHRILRLWVPPTSRKRRRGFRRSRIAPSESPRYFAAEG